MLKRPKYFLLQPYYFHKIPHLNFFTFILYSSSNFYILLRILFVISIQILADSLVDFLNSFTPPVRLSDTVFINKQGILFLLHVSKIGRASCRERV